MNLIFGMCVHGYTCMNVHTCIGQKSTSEEVPQESDHLLICCWPGLTDWARLAGQGPGERPVAASVALGSQAQATMSCCYAWVMKLRPFLTPTH